MFSCRHSSVPWPPRHLALALMCHGQWRMSSVLQRRAIMRAGSAPFPSCSLPAMRPIRLGVWDSHIVYYSMRSIDGVHESRYGFRPCRPSGETAHPCTPSLTCWHNAMCSSYPEPLPNVYERVNGCATVHVGKHVGNDERHSSFP